MGEDEKTDIAEKTEPKVEMSHTGHKNKPGTSRVARFKSWYLNRKRWTIPASVLVIVLALAAIPATRYGLAGLVVKKDLTVRVLDATAYTPVSGAVVTAGSVSVQTDGSGFAKLPKLKAGNYNLIFSKKYYNGLQYKALVPVFGSKGGPWVHLNATGRQVRISITNKINKKPLSDVNIAVADITAKTDKNGTATIVLPAGKNQQNASLSLDGYIGSKVNVKVSNNQIQQNNFSLTPAGKVYFLSKLSGKIDVVKTNLDGTDRQTVLAGTGKEDDRGTVLLASRDWHYLALLSQRAGGHSPSLYLIDTTTDQTKDIDDGNVNFSLVGWSGNHFVYQVDRNSVQIWQPHGQAIKSYNATSGQLQTLDQTNGDGTNQFDYRQEVYGQVYSLDNTVVYTKQWNYNVYNSSITDKTAGIYSINADGTNPQTPKTAAYSASQGAASIDSRVSGASEVYFAVTENGSVTYYSYENGKLTSDNSVAKNFDYTNYKAPLTYLQSPSGNNTFWAEPRDGKNTLFIGDEDSANGKQITTLSGYNTYGWFTDDYLLVSKNSSELYIMARSGDKPPIKISDYHKPAITFYGYGGGYGGL